MNFTSSPAAHECLFLLITVAATDFRGISSSLRLHSPSIRIAAFLQFCR